MRWTLGLVCFVTACFGESTTPSNTSADETTEPPTTSAATESAATESATTSGSTDSPTTSADVDTSGPPDVTESSGVDTNDMCPPGSGPNPQLMPPWQGPVFVGMPSAAIMDCPQPTTLAAVGFVGLPPTLDECECSCTESYAEICDFELRAGDNCPINTGPTAIEDTCTELPLSTTALQVSAGATSCNPDALPPANDRVVVCAMASREPCIDLVDGLRGPCIFRDEDVECPPDLVRVEAGRTGSCGVCGECDTNDYCRADAVVSVHSEADCGNAGQEVPLVSCQQNVIGAAAVSVNPSTQLTCDTTALSLGELTVCCPM